jgi:uncharacterized protein (DUF924 family)
MDDPSEVLSFWFGEIDADGRADAEQMKCWWRKDPEFDAEIRRRFFGEWQRLVNDSEAPPTTAEETLAQVIVLDQFSRNMFRNEARAFSADEHALSLARAALENGQERSLRGHQRVFLYMPFMHSERLDDQDLCVSLFSRYRDQTEGPFRAELDDNVRFA